MFIAGRSAIEHTEQTRKIFSLALLHSDLGKLQSQNLKNYPKKFFGSEDILQRFFINTGNNILYKSVF